jgi:uroporphyrinogen decarboxylase
MVKLSIIFFTMAELMKKPTLKEVAELAEVSSTTVSLVLSGKGRISEEVRKRVLEAAESSGYLKKRHTAVSSRMPGVGILVSIDAQWAMVWWFIRPIIQEIDHYFSARGYSVVIIPIHDRLSDGDIQQRILEERCSAVFALHYGSDQLLASLEEQGIPVVVIMNGRYQEQYHCILADDFQGAYEGAKHLVRLGHTDILYVETERIDLPNLSTDRFYGFRKALDEAGISFNQDHFLSCDLSNTPYLEARLHAAFTQEKHPTAVFAIDDDVAIRVIYFLMDMGFRVPEDISVLAPGDLLNYKDPHIRPITTLKIDTQLMGKLASDMMFRRITGETGNDNIHVLKIKQQLVRRGSTRAVSTRKKNNETPAAGTHRYRFLSAFTGKESRNLPCWLGASREFVLKACSELDMTEEAFHRKIGDDLRWIDPEPMGQSSQRLDSFGIERKGSGYGQPASHPLKENSTIEALRKYPWPNPEAVDISGLQERLNALGDEWAVAGGSWSPFWHDAIDLVSLETLACLMYDDPVFVETLLARIVDYYIALSTRIFEEAGNRIDLFFIRNDFGTQTGPLISPELFRRYITPCLKRFTQLGHRYDIKVMLHSSGGILPLIPEIIEAEVDALHALQPDCPGMQSAALKRNFGKQLVLSGAIDARNILRTGSPEVVHRQVLEKLQIMAPGGGYIAAPSVDVVTEDIPVENILAMYEAIKEYRRS